MYAFPAGKRHMALCLNCDIIEIVAMEQSAVPACPPQCHCEEDGIMLSVDCSELALTSVPDNLSAFTDYL
ncbi:UNVERIFIED_CONTAM: hypothetical protein K2H54_061984 [Gekko kuhli]